MHVSGQAINGIMNKEDTNRILSLGNPWSSNVPMWGEPNLGAWYTEDELNAVVNTVRESMEWTVGFGPNAKEITAFEEAFAAYCGAKFAIAINSCGTGLDMAVLSLDMEPGDEIITPAINYKASQMAVLGQGGKVVFCDIDAKTLNCDPHDIERRITPRTRAILPVHMNGLPVDIDKIIEIAERHPHPKHGPLKVIFDAARCCGALYNGTKVGQKGWMTVFSFHSQKLMTTLGEGGAIVTNDAELAKRLRNIRQFGGDDGWGSNYKMTKVQAAVGLVQLQRLDDMNLQRRRVALKRSTLLSDITGLTLPYEPIGYSHLYYTYSILVPSEWSEDKRDTFIRLLKNQYGIVCSISNPPTYKRWSYIKEKCGVPELPVSDDVGRRLFCPPIHPLMSEKLNEYICASITDAFNKVNAST